MKTFLTIEENKNWEIDFWISNIEWWDYEKQKEIRSIIITATYILESLWRKEIDKKQNLQKVQNNWIKE